MSRLFSSGVLVALAAALPVLGGEYAVLSNGFRIHAERHDIAGTSVLLYVKGGVPSTPTVKVAGWPAVTTNGAGWLLIEGPTRFTVK